MKIISSIIKNTLVATLICASLISTNILADNDVCINLKKSYPKLEALFLSSDQLPQTYISQYANFLSAHLSAACCKQEAMDPTTCQQRNTSLLFQAYYEQSVSSAMLAQMKATADGIPNRFA